MGFVIDASEENFDTAIETQLEELDVLAFVSNTTLPTTEVTVYTDADAALRVATILAAEEQRQAERDAAAKAGLESLSLADEEETDEEELTELHERLVASGLTFSLQGIAPAAFDAMEKNIRAKNDYSEGAANEEYNLALNNELVARSIVSVRSADGRVSSKKWTPKQVDTLMTNLYPSEANKLYIGSQKLAYVQNIFDAAVSADFS